MPIIENQNKDQKIEDLSKKVSEWEQKGHQLDQLDSDLANFISDIDKQKDVVNTKRKELESLQSESENIERDILILQGKLTDDKSTLAVLKRDLDNQREKIAIERVSLSREKDAFVAEKTLEEKDLKDREAKILEREKANKVYEQEVDTYAARLDEYRDRLIRTAHRRGLSADDAPNLKDRGEE